MIVWSLQLVIISRTQKMGLWLPAQKHNVVFVWRDQTNGAQKNQSHCTTEPQQHDILQPRILSHQPDNIMSSHESAPLLGRQNATSTSAQRSGASTDHLDDTSSTLREQILDLCKTEWSHLDPSAFQISQVAEGSNYRIVKLHVNYSRRRQLG